MPTTSPWKSVALGLNLKLVAMWMIFPSMLFPFVFPTHLGLLFAPLLPLLIDLVGRCYCAWAPVTETLPIKLSIFAQCTGVLGLTVLSIFLGLVGVILGLAWLAFFQVFAAKWFIKHIKTIAQNIGQPTVAIGMDELRQRLNATTMSVYGSGAISIVVLSCAFFLGVTLIGYGLGLLITIPLAFLILMPLVMTSMVLYFLMLYSYERYLKELRLAIYSRPETDNPLHS